MQVKIVKCSDDMYWWKDKIGEICKVIGELDYDYIVRCSSEVNHFGILKSDCEIVEPKNDCGDDWRNHMAFGSEVYIEYLKNKEQEKEQAKVVEEPKEQVKSCDNCKYRNQVRYSEPCDTCSKSITQRKISLNCTPKLADE